MIGYMFLKNGKLCFENSKKVYVVDVNEDMIDFFENLKLMFKTTFTKKKQIKNFNLHLPSSICRFKYAINSNFIGCIVVTGMP